MTYKKTKVSDGETALEVEGSLTGSDAEEFQSVLDEVSKEPLKILTLDFTAVTAINSATIGRILLAQRRLDESSVILQIDGCSPSVYETLKSINLDKIVTIHP